MRLMAVAMHASEDVAVLCAEDGKTAEPRRILASSDTHARNSWIYRYFGMLFQVSTSSICSGGANMVTAWV